MLPIIALTIATAAAAVPLDLVEAPAHLAVEQTLAVGDVVTVWADGESVGVLAAVGEDGLMGADFVDEHDPHYTLVLHVFSPEAPDQRQSQVLFETQHLTALPVVRWAGDLDGDARPDLLIDTGSGSGSALYLSGQAQGDALVGVLQGG